MGRMVIRIDAVVNWRANGTDEVDGKISLI